jgi:predicted nuclease of predicted toxin-antitoxin system
LSLSFYVDVHVPRAVTTELRLRKIDVLTAQEDGMAQLDDENLLRRATELGRILVSQDQDLLREEARRQQENGDFSGIVYGHQLRVTIGQMVEDLELIARPRRWENGGEESCTCRSHSEPGAVDAVRAPPKRRAHVTAGGCRHCCAI